jgi:hypothetical protein
MWSVKVGVEASLEDFLLAAGCGWSGGGGCCWVGRSWGEKCVTEVYVTMLPGGDCCVKDEDGDAMDGEFEVD